MTRSSSPRAPLEPNGEPGAGYYFFWRHSITLLTTQKEAAYLHTDDLVALQVFRQLLGWGAEFRLQLHEHPAPIGHALTLKQRTERVHRDFTILRNKTLSQETDHNPEPDKVIVNRSLEMRRQS